MLFHAEAAVALPNLVYTCPENATVQVLTPNATNTGANDTDWWFFIAPAGIVPATVVAVHALIWEERILRNTSPDQGPSWEQCMVAGDQIFIQANDPGVIVRDSGIVLK